MGLMLGVLVAAVLVSLFYPSLIGSLKPVSNNLSTGIPQRIITIAPNAAHTICALGACDRIVGVSEFCLHPAQVLSLPRVGGLIGADLERMVTLRPDLVVLRGANEAVESFCAQRGISIYMDRTDTLSGVVQTTIELGELLGLEDEAKRLVAHFSDRLSSIKERVRDLPKPRVLLILMRNPDQLANLLTTGRGTFLDEMVKVAGGVNVFGELDMRYPQTSAEAIISRHPDVIIEFLPEIEMTRKLSLRLLDQWKALGPLPAVNNHRVYFIDDDRALIPSLDCVEIVEKVSRLLHPGLGSDG